ncbi:MAG: CotH kinase family protein [Acidobacteriota bacterium]|jgi:spore coat protein CotH
MRRFLIAGSILLSLLLLPAVAQTSLPVFLDQKQVEVVHLRLDPGDWSKLQASYLDNTNYRATLEWRGYQHANVALRSRGRGTRSSTKPALRLDFNDLKGGKKFQELKSLEFENLEQDVSMLNEYLSMALFRNMGIAAPREVFVHLFVNGRDYGLHLAMEPVNRDFLAHHLGDDGGDLYEYSWSEPWQWTPRGAAESSYSPAIFKLRTNKKSASPRAIADFVNSLAAANSTNFEQTAGRTLDVKQLIRYLAVETFLADTDGLSGDQGANNFFLYRRARDGNFEFLPWDKDAALVRYERSIWQGVSQSELLRKMLDVPQQRQAFLAELQRVVNLVESEDNGLLRLAHEMLKTTRPFAFADPVKRYKNAEYEEAITTLFHFLKERPRLVREQIAAEQ